MIRVRGQLRCMTEGERAKVLATMEEHIRLSRAEPACLSFDIAETDDPMVFEVIESFRDHAGFATHQARTRESPWFTATRSILRDFRIEEVGD